MDFDRTPFIIIWETTRSCDLACVHCRASAQPQPLPHELTDAEGLDLIDQVAALGTRVLVLSGGDPLKRPNLCALIRHAKDRGLRVGTIPAGTPRLTRRVVQALKDAGLDQMALSLDASTGWVHDRFRGVEGAHARVLKAARWAHEVGLPLQINTVFSAYNVEDMDELIALVQRLGIVFWEVFFLVPVGRGAALGGLSAEQCEMLFGKLYELQRTAPFVVKVTEGPHYRRYLLQRQQAARRLPARTMIGNGHPGAVGRWVEHGPEGSIGLAPGSVNAGKGHCFISCTGDVFPSGFLPLAVGNIRTNALADLYRDAPVFRELRDPDRLKGRCGLCEFRAICGGSRARAYAMTGDYLAEDPWCAYIPAARRASTTI